MSDPTIRLNSKGPAVERAQQQLVTRSYLPPGSDDGTFGPVTGDAVVRYQSERAAGRFYAYSKFALEVDGVVGPRTWSRLAPPTVRSGSKGGAVELLQQILRDTGYPAYDPGAVDGAFGPATAAAVRAVQGDYVDVAGDPLAVDGVAGPMTWCALWS